MDAPASLPLRPLSIGEMFDRAVTLYVRNFALFTLLILTVSIPAGFAQYELAGPQAASMMAAITAIQHPAPAGTSAAKIKPVNPFKAFTPALVAEYVVLVLLVLMLSPFATNAVAVGVASLYSNRAPTFGACFRATLQRWPQILGLLFSWIGMGLGVYIALVLVAVVLASIAIGIAKYALVVSIAIAIVGIAALIAIGILAIGLVLAITFSFFSVCVEGRSVAASIGSGIMRIFNRAEFWKAVLLGLAYLAIEFGALSISASIGFALLLLLKSTALQVAVSTAFSALLSGFLTVLVAVYYFDVRIRREGFDLEADLQRLNA